MRARQHNPEEFRAQVEKAFACIPELPPQLRAAAERFKRRFEQSRSLAVRPEDLSELQRLVNQLLGDLAADRRVGPIARH